MAFSETYDVATPAGSDDPAEADDRMQEIKAAVQEREDVDHYWEKTGTQVSDADTGEHRKITLRTLSAAVVAALTATKAYLYRLITDGELYWKDDDDNTLQLTDKGNNLPNDTYLKATNKADDGSVDLIKAGRNEADDADVAFISDAARMASNTAPGEDTGVANKKYVDDQIAAKQYDSGWFSAVTGGTYVKTHNLGSTALLITLFCKTSGGMIFVANLSINVAVEEGASVLSISTTQLTVQAGQDKVGLYYDTNGQIVAVTSGSYRVCVRRID